MIVIGLTGSIGMGKSTAVRMFRRLGLPVHDADASVHRLIGPGGAAVPLVAAAFPGVVCGGAVDRQKLGKRVFEDPAALVRLEAILHPLARRSALQFLAVQQRLRRPMAVLDIPLLFETHGEALCDVVVVVSAPAFLQRARVLHRPGMTRDKLAGILARQMSDREKRERADFVIETGLHKGQALKSLRRVIRELRAAGRRRGARPDERGRDERGRDA